MRLQICAANLRLHVQGDLADAAFHFQVNGRRRLSICIVGVGIAIVFQSMHIDGADTAGRMCDDTDVFRKADVGLAHPAFNVRGQIRFAVTGEVDIHLACPEIEIQPGERNVAKMQIPLSSANIEPGVCRFRSLQIDRLHIVMRSRIEAVAVGKTAPVPEKQDEYRNESDCTDATADGNRRSRIGIAASIRAIPNLPNSDKDENERPVGPEDWAGIESRTPVVQQKESPHCNKDDWNNERHSPGLTVLGHGTPRYLVLRTRKENSSASDWYHCTTS